uniref:Uncharacterized protein n=1 Tax=Meloidogyne enterolobii TaxID=390850 RepID=A0A6V7UBF8_MELEN|nr:unnamed protein product [Meloidogyne enterolobii]
MNFIPNFVPHPEVPQTPRSLSFVSLTQLVNLWSLSRYVIWATTTDPTQV